MNGKAELKKAYLQNPPPSGIYKITNRVTGGIFIGKGLNVHGILNSQQSQLKWGAHMNAQLQQDWNQYGAENFTFEVIDYLQSADRSARDQAADLAELERLWLDKLQPYGDKGYNWPRKKEDIA